MPTTATLLLPYPAPTDPADVPLDVQRLADRLEVVWPTKTAGGIPLTPSATPPASPVEGTLWAYRLTSPNAGTWLFRYNAADSRWDFIGGPPLFSFVGTTSGPHSNTVYGDATTGDGPSVTIPLAGDYIVELGAKVQNAAATLAAGVVSYAIGATAAADTDALSITMAAVSGPNVQGARPSRKNALGAVVLLCKYRVTAGTFNFGDRYLRVTPVRI